MLARSDGDGNSKVQQIVEWTVAMSLSEFDQPEASDDVFVSEPNFSVRKRKILICLLIYSAVLGIISALQDDESTDRAVDFQLGLPGLILGIYWCRTDAAERDHGIGTFTSGLLVLFFLAGLPLYLFQTRGLRAFQSLGWLLLFLALMFASMIAGAVGVIFVQDPQAFGL